MSIIIYFVLLVKPVGLLKYKRFLNHVTQTFVGKEYCLCTHCAARDNNTPRVGYVETDVFIIIIRPNVLMILKKTCE